METTWQQNGRCRTLQAARELWEGPSSSSLHQSLQFVQQQYGSVGSATRMLQDFGNITPILTVQLIVSEYRDQMSTRQNSQGNSRKKAKRRNNRVPCFSPIPSLCCYTPNYKCLSVPYLKTRRNSDSTKHVCAIRKGFQISYEEGVQFLV